MGSHAWLRVLTYCNTKIISLSDSMGKQGNEPGEFEEPRDIAIDTNGNVLVTDTKKNCLLIFDKHGNFIRVISSASVFLF